MDRPILVSYLSFAFTEEFWELEADERRETKKALADALKQLPGALFLYGVFPARSETDFLVWHSQTMEEDGAAGDAMNGIAQAFAPFREFVTPTQSLWGFTKPSMYSRGKSEQDMDPFEGERSRYIIVYPFSKTKEWYLMSFDARQGMMNEHIKLGKQYADIKQLLVYSFGLQDYEFVVAYECENLPRFSELVQGLRSTEARRYTLLDAPLVVGVRKDLEQFIEE